MHAVIIVIMLGLGLNAATGANSLDEANANFLNQFANPVVVADYSNLNQ